MRKSVKQVILFRILLCVVSVYTAQSAFAAPVSYENALTYASRFFGDSISLRSVNLSKLNLQESAKAKFQPFYIFNKAESEGFVIVSGDDNMPQILGYSDKNNFPEDVNTSDSRGNFPPQLQWLLEMYSAALKDMAQSQTVNTQRHEKSNRPAVLLKTVEWGQGYPYNLNCPDNCITGCGATALATILKYHSDTRKGYGVKEYEWNGRYLSYDFDHTFEWDKMVSSYDEHTYFTSENAEAVADLMYACGVLLEMDYGLNESSSYASKASECARYLNYSPSGWYLNQNSSNISDSQWRDILDEELDAGYPIFGSSDISGDTGIVKCKQS